MQAIMRIILALAALFLFVITAEADFKKDYCRKKEYVGIKTKYSLWRWLDGFHFSRGYTQGPGQEKPSTMLCNKRNHSRQV